MSVSECLKYRVCKLLSKEGLGNELWQLVFCRQQVLYNGCTAKLFVVKKKNLSNTILAKIETLHTLLASALNYIVLAPESCRLHTVNQASLQFSFVIQIVSHCAVTSHACMEPMMICIDQCSVQVTNPSNTQTSLRTCAAMRCGRSRGVGGAL